MDDEFDLESLANLEQTYASPWIFVRTELTPYHSFYDAGYKDGFAHGEIHGLIEGRALGREKGFEMWEELGFYEGFTRVWMAVYVKQGKGDE
jgi:hypothetical protein